jgi:hypothetical protein
LDKLTGPLEPPDEIDKDWLYGLGLYRIFKLVSLFKQAKEQGAVSTGVDVASMMRLSPGTISNYVRQWAKEHQEIVPRRGTIHDMGRSITHKKTDLLPCHRSRKVD